MAKENSKERIHVLIMDLGKDSTKAIGMEYTDKLNPEKLHKECFKTKSYNLINGDVDVCEGSHKVQYEDNNLILGKQGSDRSYDNTKTLPLNQMCAYTAIAQYLEPGSKNNKVNIVLACPIAVLNNMTTKQEYKDLISNNGKEVNIVVDGKDYAFTIEDITIKAESSGIRYLAPELFEDKNVMVIDFGGLNMTVTVFQNGACVNPQKNRFALEHGAFTLINEVADSLTAYKKAKNIVSFDDAEAALNRGYGLKGGKKDAKSIEWIDKAKEKFFQDALTLISAKGFVLDNYDSVICIGGTSAYLKDQIDALDNGVTVEDPQWASVEGLFGIAVAKYGNAKIAE